MIWSFLYAEQSVCNIAYMNDFRSPVICRSPTMLFYDYAVPLKSAMLQKANNKWCPGLFLTGRLKGGLWLLPQV